MNQFSVTRTFKPLYKRGARGEVRTWCMQIGCNDSGEWATRVLSGIVGGKQAESGWSVGVPKNIGKANETDSKTQALSEIESEYKKKRRTGYMYDMSEVDSSKFLRPMLAHDWSKRKDKTEFPVFSQPKLDGIRCLAKNDGLWSRTGKKIVSCPHIEDVLSPFFQQHPDVVLDGELYSHALRDDFNKITSVVRKTKVSDEDAQIAAEIIQYHVYDVVDTMVQFSERYRFLEFVPEHPVLVVVPTSEAETEEDVDALYQQYLMDGYEGQIIRTNATYENKRSTALMKRKEFLSDEFKVLDVHEGVGNWAGAVKRFSLSTADGTLFGAGVRGDRDSLIELLQSGKVPTWATVRYFTPTPDGVPRFPVVVDYGFEGERQD